MHSSSTHLHSQGAALLLSQIKAPALPRWASVHQPPARQGSQPRHSTVDSQILNSYYRGTSHFQQVKIQLMQTHVFVQVYVLHSHKSTHYWCDEAVYSPSLPCLPPRNTHLLFPSYDVESGDEEGTSLPKEQQGRSWMQEKPSRNDDELYGSIPYHSDNGKICAGEIKNGQSTTAGDCS